MLILKWDLGSYFFAVLVVWNVHVKFACKLCLAYSWCFFLSAKVLSICLFANLTKKSVSVDLLLFIGLLCLLVNYPSIDSVSVDLLVGAYISDNHQQACNLLCFSGCSDMLAIHC